MIKVPANGTSRRNPSRRQFLGYAGGLALGGSFAGRLAAQATDGSEGSPQDLLLVNGRIHTMDPARRVVSEVLVRNGRFTEVGENLTAPAGVERVDLGGRTVIPGLIDAHNHIVLVGNRPGWSTPIEHVFNIPDAVAALQARSNEVPDGEFITAIGPASAMQLAERRLPNLSELDAVGRAVYIQAAQGGTVTNTAGKSWLEARGVMVGADGSLPRQSAGPALLALREEFLTPETRQRSAEDALHYYARLGITTHKDAGAFHSDQLSGGLASENTFTMHNPFLALHRARKMPARLRIDFLHQDPPDADPPLPTLSNRLKYSFPYFGDDWIRTGGIGEFTGGGIAGLRAIAVSR